MGAQLSRFFHHWHPERFHDPGSKRPYFEGWYFKMVSKDRKHKMAVIPGVFLDEHNNEHCFIQILDGTHQTDYHRFPYRVFHAQGNPFRVRIEENLFSPERLILNVRGDHRRIQGELIFKNRHPWPVRLFSPGVMGWYAFVPTMECYHGVLSMDHTIEGTLTVDGHDVDFSGGRGYMEKDWGVSFPLTYVWLQCNHFHQHNVSVMVSVAHIPWKKRTFRGFLVGLLMEGRFIRLTTYTGAVIGHLSVSDHEVSMTCHDRRIQLELKAKRRAGGTLYGPDGIQMHQHVSESLCSDVSLTVRERNQILLQSIGHPAALEVHGPLNKLLDPVS
jgi:tocopherol cyclase